MDEGSASRHGGTGDDFAGGQASLPDGSRTSLYRLDSNHSNASVFEDVEMAHDEVSRLLKVTIPNASVNVLGPL